MNLRRNSQREDLDISMNLVSFIDVLLCLVIFFMVSTNFVNRSNIALRLPKADAVAGAPEPSDKIEVLVDAKGQVYIDNTLVQDHRKEAMQQALLATARERHIESLLISADGEATHQAVIDVLDAAREAGLVRVSFATDRVRGTPEHHASR